MAKFENTTGRPLQYGESTIEPGGAFEAEKLPRSLQLIAKGLGAKLDAHNPPAGAQLRPGDEQKAEDEAKAAETAKAKAAAEVKSAAAKPAAKA